MFTVVSDEDGQGTPCKETNQNRTTEIRYYCNPNSPNQYTITEYGYCKYLVRISDRQICNIPLFEAVLPDETVLYCASEEEVKKIEKEETNKVDPAESSLNTDVYFHAKKEENSLLNSYRRIRDQSGTFVYVNNKEDHDKVELKPVKKDMMSQLLSNAQGDPKQLEEFVKQIQEQFGDSISIVIQQGDGEPIPITENVVEISEEEFLKSMNDGVEDMKKEESEQKASEGVKEENVEVVKEEEKEEVDESIEDEENIIEVVEAVKEQPHEINEPVKEEQQETIEIVEPVKEQQNNIEVVEPIKEQPHEMNEPVPEQPQQINEHTKQNENNHMNNELQFISVFYFFFLFVSLFNTKQFSSSS